MTLAEIVERLLCDRGVRTTDSSVDRFFKRRNVSYKKNSARSRTGAARRGRSAATLEGRTALLYTTRLVFVDETGTSTKMVRTRGRCRRGQRLIGKVPFGHWKTTTFTAGLRCDGLVAPFVLDGPMNGGNLPVKAAAGQAAEPSGFVLAKRERAALRRFAMRPRAYLIGNSSKVSGS